MHFVKVTRPRYEQSRRYDRRVGEVVGHWGPENSEDGREGLMVEFGDGEVVGLTHEEIEEVAPEEAREALLNEREASDREPDASSTS